MALTLVCHRLPYVLWVCRATVFRQGRGRVCAGFAAAERNGLPCAGPLSFFSSLGGSGITELLLSLKQLYANSPC